MTRPEYEYQDLLPSREQVAGICSAAVWMLLYPLALQLDLDDGLAFRVAGRPVYLFLRHAFLCQGAYSLITKQTAVGRDPPQGSCVTLAEDARVEDGSFRSMFLSVCRACRTYKDNSIEVRFLQQCAPLRAFSGIKRNGRDRYRLGPATSQEVADRR